MSWLKTFSKLPKQYDPAQFKMIIERIRTAVNFLDGSNFPNGLDGGLLNENSIDPTKLTGCAWVVPILALADAKTTVSTDGISVGGFIQWSAAIWGINVQCYLQVTGNIANAAATATFTLHSTTGVLATCTTQSTDFVALQSIGFIPPIASQSIVFKMKTSNASYAASVLNANLIIVPIVSS